MTTLAGFWRKETPAPSPANAAPAPLRVAHGISALGIIAIFLAMHLANHLTFILGHDTYRAVMKGMRPELTGSERTSSSPRILIQPMQAFYCCIVCIAVIHAERD
jgi:hypothetical protein